MANAPLRKIIYSTEPTIGSRTKCGIMVTSTLECGHVVSTTKTERNKNRCYCFDCFYHKKPSYLGIAILEERGLKPIEGE